MSSLQKYKTKIFVLILLVCVICVGIVWLNASASKLQYEINTVNNKIQEPSWQIRSTEAKVSIQSNIASLEEKAGELGMVRANFGDIIYLKGDSESVEDFALALRENVYR